MKKWFWKAVLIVVLLGAIVAGIAIWYFLTHLEEIALGMLYEQYPALVFTIGSAHIQSFDKLELINVRVHDLLIDPDNSVIEIAKIRLGLDIISREPKIGWLKVEKPTININTVGDSVPIIGRLLKKTDQDKEVNIGYIKVNGGKFNFSDGERGVSTDFYFQLLSLPHLEQKQASVSLENLTIQDPALLFENKSCTLSFDVVQYESSRFEVNNGKFNAADAEFDFSSQFDHVDNRLKGGIDFKTTDVMFNDIAFIYEEHIPWQFTFDGAIALNGHAEIDIGDTMSILLNGKARVRDSRAKYSIGSKSFEFEGIQAMAEWCLNPLAAPFGGGGLKVDCALFMDKVRYGVYEIEDVSSWVNILDQGVVIDNVVGSAYGGKLMGSGNIDITDTAIAYNLNMGILDFDAEKLVKSIESKDVYMTGMANGSLNWQGRIGEISRLSMEMETDPKGGMIQIQNTERFLNNLPGGEQSVSSLQDSLGSREWNIFIKSMENYQYEDGSFKFEIDPDNLEMSLVFSFSSKSPTVGDRNLELVVHDIDKQLIPKVTF